MAVISSSNKSESGLARFFGSASSGFLELIIFHPIDTIAKRLMYNQQKMFGPNKQTTLSKTIFKDKHLETAYRRYLSLFPGLGFAFGYKVSQRIYKFGGQPYVNDYLNKNHKEAFHARFGEKNGKFMMHALAGSIVGIGEIFLLPLDVLKIKAQNNPDSIKGRNIMNIFMKEGRKLYSGAGWTALRNAPGSFALFGGSAIAKERIFKLEEYNKATFMQNFVSSIVGSIASIIVAAPLDVIKTRIQTQSFETKTTGLKIIKNMIAKEGVLAFFKGLTPKIIVVGPKLVFSFTVAQQLIPYFDKALK